MRFSSSPSDRPIDNGYADFLVTEASPPPLSWPLFADVLKTMGRDIRYESASSAGQQAARVGVAFK